MSRAPRPRPALVRLVPRATAPADLPAGTSRTFSDDLVAVLVDDTGHPLDDDAVERLGGPRAARTTALQALGQVVADLEVHHLGNEEVGVTLLTSDSPLTAATALVLPAILAHAELGAAPDGVFVATPTPTELLVHPLRDTRSVASLQVLTQMTHAGFQQSDDPLSPHVHWWDGTTTTQLTSIDAERTRLHVGPELQAVLERLCS
ncbi:hypothetical protein [Aeromicrobium halocynthiae]|uniref:hypothetical protein n=1 Tax=Aeromicrobium halocynthiae TaxID=560557 RepID=UPI0031CEA706